MSTFTECWVPSKVQDLPRVASRATDEWALCNKPEEGDFLPLKAYAPLPTPEHIIRAAQEAAAHAYSAPARGLPLLRGAICQQLSAECGIAIDPESEVLITNGGMNALHIVFLTLLEPGDEVIVPSPCFFLEGLVQGLGARLVFVPTDEEHDFKWDMDRIENAITPRSKILLLNTPVNPTGRVLTRQELQQIGKIAEAHNICILSDESYDRLTYDGRKHLSPLAVPDSRERTVLIRSFTKSYVMPAWRVGYIVAEAGLTAAFVKMFEWTNLYVNHVSQAAAAAAITGPQDWLAESASILQATRDRLLDWIRGIEGLSCVKPEGGPFIFPNVSKLGVSGDTFAELLFRRFGVPAVAGSAMQAPQFVRIPMGATGATVDELVSRLHKAVEQCRRIAGN
jgi:aspartate/methionine/tyrosine aminotransferase